MKDYKKQYLDPRWQKKRLEILEKANWQCEICGNKDKTLHVHHKSYISGRDVWDYPDEDLMCLCEDCHKKEHEKAMVKKYINEIIYYIHHDSGYPFNLNDIRDKKWFLWHFFSFLLKNIQSDININRNADIIFEFIFDYLNLELKVKRD